jgi:hypothetical protein
MQDKKEFIENIHFYLENGKIIFTEKYLKDRNHCCGNSCRHCPFTKPVKKGNKKLQ